MYDFKALDKAEYRMLFKKLRLKYTQTDDYRRGERTKMADGRTQEMSGGRHTHTQRRTRTHTHTKKK